MKKVTANVISLGMGLALLFGFLQVVPVLAATRTANFQAGDRIVLVTKVNVRATANGTLVGKQTAGTFGTVTGSPQNAGGYVWWSVKYDTGVSGWTAEDFLQKAAVSDSKQTVLKSLLSQIQAQTNRLLTDVTSINKALQAAVAASQ